ncbi:MAG: HAMP domain-containing histidine kinase [Lachnospiraceae bacterium]|nr:HAMP domain-containing histidine kinase [Lachnospiraceae bacterium]
MKYSISTELPLLIIGLLVVTVGTALLCNRLFMSDYYVSQKAKALVASYDLIKQATQNDTLDTEGFDDRLENISNRYSVEILIVDVNSNTLKFVSKDPDRLKFKLWDHLFLQSNDNAPTDGEEGEIIVNNSAYTVEVCRDMRSDSNYIELWGNLDGGDMIIMTSALDSIMDSVHIANTFIAYILIGIMVIGALLAWLIARRITKPVLKLADISDRIARLDFNARYTDKSNNEIGFLGDNINKLSDSLEKNISELKTANNELMRDIEKKDRLEEQRKEFLSNVSHELKTPIALISGYAEGLTEGIASTKEDMDYYCNVIIEEAGKMNTIVARLLTLNQLEYGEDRVEIVRFDLAAMLKNCIQSTEILTKRNDIEVGIDCPDELYAWGDEFKVEEVFVNFLSNAINHCEGEKKIEIKVVTVGDHVRVTVFNSGQRIPEESIGYIWDKFYKVDKARTRKYGGSGVGLSIVKAIMESLNQRYGVDNYDNGVAFWFELDSARAEVGDDL